MTSTIIETDLISLAARFVNSTRQHVFLTGKAGTGKTTFLRDLAQRTHKNFVIVAPTGIAALNAQGVTIHSQFQLPFGSYIPVAGTEEDLTGTSHFYTQRSLSYKNHLSTVKKQVLRSIELLIIDEVSMLRADILDAIDYRLRAAKGIHHQPFGGVQVLMIGDLYQLPPIVKPHEKQVLGKYYRSMHFFEALALKESGMVFLELDKIFRQSDDAFISILNNLRNDNISQSDLNTLNSKYKSEEDIRKEGEVIRLTTHNYKADKINERELNSLDGKVTVFDSLTEDLFPENLYPLPSELKLKKGAQVMFIKNDRSGEGRYYNGKLAKVVSVNKDEIQVQLADSTTKLTLDMETWENKKYHLNEENKELEEEVVGTFSQYPIKLAWAVTIHKCQGLTFDKAVIDVSDAFAHGQVYVAMSRLRSLDGLILSQKLSANAVSTDPEVVEYSKTQDSSEHLQEKLSQGQEGYIRDLVADTFSLSSIHGQLTYLQQSKGDKMEFEDQEMREAVDKIRAAFESEKGNIQKYRRQLQELLKLQNTEALLDRLAKGSAYYLKFLEARLNELLIHLSHVEQFSRTKAYLNALLDVDQSIVQKMREIEKVSRLTQAILTGKKVVKEDMGLAKSGELRSNLMEAARKQAKENPKKAGGRSGRKKKGGKKRKKGETYLITYALLDKGKDIAAVAKERELAKSTIEGHVARGIGEGRLKLQDYLSSQEIEEISAKLKESDDRGGAYGSLNGKYSHSQIKMVVEGEASSTKDTESQD